MEIIVCTFSRVKNTKGSSWGGGVSIYIYIFPKKTIFFCSSLSTLLASSASKRGRRGLGIAVVAFDDSGERGFAVYAQRGLL